MILADTSVWIDYLRDEPATRPRLKAMLDDRTVLTCGPVVAELLAGARGHRRDTLWESLVALPRAALDASVWHAVGEASGELLRRGRRIPLTDVAIGVAAARSGALLWTLDTHFTRVAEVVGDLELFEAR